MMVCYAQVYEGVRDFARAAIDFPFDTLTGDAVKAAAFPAKLAAAFEKYLPLFEALIDLNPDSETYTVQATPTFADVALASELKRCVIMMVILVVLFV